MFRAWSKREKLGKLQGYTMLTRAGSAAILPVRSILPQPFQKRRCSLEKFLIRGDRLLLVFDVLYLLTGTQPWQNVAEYHNPVGLSGRKFREHFVGDKYNFREYAQATLPLQEKLRAIRDFLRAIQPQIAQIEVDGAPLFCPALVNVDKRHEIVDAIASGELTEEMLKEPRTEPAASTG